MTSTGGLLPPAQRIVEFDGDVRLRAAAAAAATGAVVRTEHLSLDLDSNLATTTDPVHIDFGSPRGQRARAARRLEARDAQARIRGQWHLYALAA